MISGTKPKLVPTILVRTIIKLGRNKFMVVATITMITLLAVRRRGGLR